MHKLSVAVLFLLRACLAQPAPAPPAPPAFRLGDEVAPRHYQVSLRIVPSEETFSGMMDIQLEVRRPTAVIWVNGEDLTIEQASLRAGAENLSARPITGHRDFIGFQLERPAPAGPATLHIVYRGPISSRSSAGIFRNKVGDDWYVYTQFEPIDARRAFPCFDEPGFKVPWQVTLQVPLNTMALSNTPVESVTQSAMQSVRFAETRPLPSYLIAFAVGPFQAVNAGYAGKNRVPLRIITPLGMTDQARYAAEVTPRILDVLENYFGVPYAYPKLDSVAVPLFGGAMENPGLITYGQTLILAKPAEDSAERQREYASVAAHEMAHLWFGDLVTTEWWNDIWLNEAFATWMARKALEQWKPAWHEDISGAAERQMAMGADGLVSARKIRQPVEGNGDIANAFDTITYEKGASVIYMFEQWVKPEVFRKGVERYLERHADGNATAADFLAAQSAAAGRDIAPAFSTFLDQPGVPLVTAELKCGAGRSPAVVLSQRRFLPLGSPASGGEVWQIPLLLRDEAGQQSELLAQPSGEVRLAAKACPAWLAMNAGESGYYRVHYRGGLMAALAADGGRRLDPRERIGLLGDARALMAGGELPAAEALGLVPEFAHDPARQVVEATIRITAGIRQHLVPDNLRPNYARFVEKVYGARARELGWTPKPGESEEVRLLRPDLVGLVANEGEDQPLILEAQALAGKWLADRGAIVPEMAEVVLETAARHSGRDLYDRLAGELKKTADPRQREQIVGAMGAFRDPAIVKENFNLLLTGGIDLREAFPLITEPLEDARTEAVPFQTVRADYDRLLKILPQGILSGAAARLPMVGGHFCTVERRNELEGFFKERSAKATGGPRILAQTLERVDQCIAVRKVQEPSVAAFLRNY